MASTPLRPRQQTTLAFGTPCSRASTSSARMSMSPYCGCTCQSPSSLMHFHAGGTPAQSPHSNGKAQKQLLLPALMQGTLHTTTTSQELTQTNTATPTTTSANTTSISPHGSHTPVLLSPRSNAQLRGLRHSVDNSQPNVKNSPTASTFTTPRHTMLFSRSSVFDDDRGLLLTSSKRTGTPVSLDLQDGPNKSTPHTHSLNCTPLPSPSTYHRALPRNSCTPSPDHSSHHHLDDLWCQESDKSKQTSLLNWATIKVSLTGSVPICIPPPPPPPHTPTLPQFLSPKFQKNRVMATKWKPFPPEVVSTPIIESPTKIISTRPTTNLSELQDVPTIENAVVNQFDQLTLQSDVSHIVTPLAPQPKQHENTAEEQFHKDSLFEDLAEKSTQSKQQLVLDQGPQTQEVSLDTEHSTLPTATDTSTPQISRWSKNVEVLNQHPCTIELPSQFTRQESFLSTTSETTQLIAPSEHTAIQTTDQEPLPLCEPSRDLQPQVAVTQEPIVMSIDKSNTETDPAKGIEGSPHIAPAISSQLTQPNPPVEPAPDVVILQAEHTANLEPTIQGDQNISTAVAVLAAVLPEAVLPEITLPPPVLTEPVDEVVNRSSSSDSVQIPVPTEISFAKEAHSENSKLYLVVKVPPSRGKASSSRKEQASDDDGYQKSLRNVYLSCMQFSLIISKRFFLELQEHKAVNESDQKAKQRIINRKFFWGPHHQKGPSAREKQQKDAQEQFLSAPLVDGLPVPSELILPKHIYSLQPDEAELAVYEYQNNVALQDGSSALSPHHQHRYLTRQDDPNRQEDSTQTQISPALPKANVRLIADYDPPLRVSADISFQLLHESGYISAAIPTHLAGKPLCQSLGKRGGGILGEHYKTAKKPTHGKDRTCATVSDKAGQLFTSEWQEQEIELFKELYCLHGTNWDVISSLMHFKSPPQLQEFFTTNVQDQNTLSWGPVNKCHFCDEVVGNDTWPICTVCSSKSSTQSTAAQSLPDNGAVTDSIHSLDEVEDQLLSAMSQLIIEDPILKNEMDKFENPDVDNSDMDTSMSDDDMSFGSSDDESTTSPNTSRSELPGNSSTDSTVASAQTQALPQKPAQPVSTSSSSQPPVASAAIPSASSDVPYPSIQERAKRRRFHSPAYTPTIYEFTAPVEIALALVLNSSCDPCVPPCKEAFSCGNLKQNLEGRETIPPINQSTVPEHSPVVSSSQLPIPDPILNQESVEHTCEQESRDSRNNNPVLLSVEEEKAFAKEIAASVDRNRLVSEVKKFIRDPHTARTLNKEDTCSPLSIFHHGLGPIKNLDSCISIPENVLRQRMKIVLDATSLAILSMLSSSTNRYVENVSSSSWLFTADPSHIDFGQWKASLSSNWVFEDKAVLEAQSGDRIYFCEWAKNKDANCVFALGTVSGPPLQKKSGKSFTVHVSVQVDLFLDEKITLTSLCKAGVLSSKHLPPTPSPVFGTSAIALSLEETLSLCNSLPSQSSSMDSTDMEPTAPTAKRRRLPEPVHTSVHKCILCNDTFFVSVSASVPDTHVCRKCCLSDQLLDEILAKVGADEIAMECNSLVQQHLVNLFPLKFSLEHSFPSINKEKDLSTARSPSPPTGPTLLSSTSAPQVTNTSTSTPASSSTTNTTPTTSTNTTTITTSTTTTPTPNSKLFSELASLVRNLRETIFLQTQPVYCNWKKSLPLHTNGNTNKHNKVTPPLQDKTPNSTAPSSHNDAPATSIL
ncbi:hypothetical protein Pelo_12739 [Pelomyxa schiedti]|nr:hypothetical protein Pelo_12739 [Pelomyxa schiedti]